MSANMPDAAIQWQRRRMLALAGICAMAGSVPLAGAAQAPTGWVLPRLAAPPFRIIAADGRKVPFAGLVAGKVTAVQLMFTGCSSRIER